MQQVYPNQLLQLFGRLWLVLLLASPCGLLKAAETFATLNSNAGAKPFNASSLQTTCPTINPDLVVETSSVCNAEEGVEGSFTATITVKKSQLGISYTIVQYIGITPYEEAGPLSGNGGDLVFEVSAYYRGNSSLPDFAYFQVVANDCRGNEVNLSDSPTVSIWGPVGSPSISGVTINSGQTATLQVNTGEEEYPHITTYAWYAAATGGSALATGLTFTTPALTASKTYYVATRQGGCESVRKPVTVTVNGPFARRLNAGGSSYTTADGKVFAADANFTGGSVSSITAGEVLNTSEDALYRNLRTGAFSYSVPSGNGTFDVVLHFNETYYGYRTGGGIGSRKFNVDIEGVRKLTNYDIFAKAGGAMRAVRETIRVTVTDGTLNLAFVKGLADNPAVAAIEVLAAPAPKTLRVNAGGNGSKTLDGRVFAADAYFSGGTASTPTNLGIGGTGDDYLYQTGRSGTSFAYNLPTGNGSFDVVLHFAETYFGNTVSGGVGSRQFHVNMEGARKLTNYDVFAKAGGALKARQEVLRVNVSDGTLNVNFLKGAANNPAVRAIEVLPAGSALSINAGGSSFTTTAGKVFSSDVYFANGSTSSIASGEVANTTNDALYLNARVGVFSYGLPSGNGTFNVTLHFNETYYGYRTGGGIGSRKFNVDIEGSRKLTGFDIFAAAGGAMKAVTRTIQVTVTDGTLNLFFSKGTADNPAVSAIEVVAVTVASARTEAQPEAVLQQDMQVQVYPNPAAERLTVRLPFPASQVRGTAVMSATGEGLMQDGHRVLGEYELEVPVGRLKAGLYLLQVDSGQGRQVVRFVKAN